MHGATEMADRRRRRRRRRRSPRCCRCSRRIPQVRDAQSLPFPALRLRTTLVMPHQELRPDCHISDNQLSEIFNLTPLSPLFLPEEGSLRGDHTMPHTHLFKLYHYRTSRSYDSSEMEARDIFLHGRDVHFGGRGCWSPV